MSFDYLKMYKNFMISVKSHQFAIGLLELYKRIEFSKKVHIILYYTTTNEMKFQNTISITKYKVNSIEYENKLIHVENQILSKTNLKKNKIKRIS